MSTDIDSAMSDLAYMRGVVNEGGNFQATAGELFLWAGACYGLQCFGHYLNIIGLLPLSPLGGLLLTFGPTVVLVGALCLILWRRRKTPTGGGVASRALNAAFQGAGIANLVLACVFAYGAYKAQSMVVWLYHPVVVCMFQGVAWYVAWAIRRRAWHGFVALGWFATTVALGFLLYDIASFMLMLAVALLVLMGGSGYALARSGRAGA